MTTKDNKDVKQLFKGWAFGKKNYLIFSIGLALVIIGYIFMYYMEQLQVVICVLEEYGDVMENFIQNIMVKQSFCFKY